VYKKDKLVIVKPVKRNAKKQAVKPQIVNEPLYEDKNVVVFSQTNASSSHFIIDETNIFEAMLSPISQDYFFENVF
jgi:hypothetical protein